MFWHWRDDRSIEEKAKDCLESRKTNLELRKIFCKNLKELEEIYKETEKINETLKKSKCRIRSSYE